MYSTGYERRRNVQWCVRKKIKLIVITVSHSQSGLSFQKIQPGRRGRQHLTAITIPIIPRWEGVRHTTTRKHIRTKRRTTRLNRHTHIPSRSRSRSRRCPLPMRIPRLRILGNKPLAGVELLATLSSRIPTIKRVTRIRRHTNTTNLRGSHNTRRIRRHTLT